MKKLFIFLTMLVLGIVSMWAATPVTQITSGSSYYFFNSRFNQYINTSKQTDENLFNGIKFTLTGSDGNYNIYSADLGGYLTWGTLENGQVPTISQGTSENTLWTIDVQSGSIMNIYPKGHGSTGGFELISQSVTAGKSIALWTFGNQGGQWYIYEASDFEAEKNGITSAVAKITSGKPYRIFTEYGNNNTKYYLTADGTLSTSENDAYYFTFTATTSNQYVPAGKAWRISSTSSKYFTNGSESSGAVQFRGSINTTTGQNRDTYEGQVFVWDDTSGKYAVRSTNNKSHSSYAENSYWMVDDTDDDGVPEAGYCTTLEERHYDWQLEEPSNYITFNLYYNGTKLATKNDVPKLLGQSSASLPEGWDCAYCNLSYSPTTIENATTSVDVTLTWDGPFEFSSGFEGAKWYYLSLRNKGKYVQMSTTIPYPDPTTKPTVSEGLWAFTGDPYNGVKVMNARAGDGKYLKKVSADNASAVTIQDGGQYWAIGVGKDGFYLKEPGNNNLYIHDLGNALKIWNSSSGATDNGSGFQVEEASPVKVTYKLTYNGNVISSYTKDLYELVGATAAAPHDWELPLYCSLGSCSPATIEAGTTEVTIPLNWDGPFDISPDFENANWYYLKMHGQYLIYSGSSTTPNSLDDLASAESAASKAFWAFVGDPFNGFQLINKAAGSDKNLAVKWWNPNMDTPETKWLLQSWNSDFALRTSSYFYLNNADGQLKLWVSGTSTEAMNFDCAIESVSYKGLALDFIDDYANSHALGQYFGVSTSTYNSVRASYADAASVSESDYTFLVSHVSGMLPASYPETGYYRIKSNSGRYIGYGQPVADPMPSVGLRTVSAEDAATDVSTIFRLVKGVGSHQYTLSTEGLNVQSMKSSNTPFPATNDVGATFVLTASTTNPGKGTIYNAASNDDGSEYINGYLHEANWSVPGVINWLAGSTSSQWEIEDATSFSGTLTNANDNTGTGHSYATLCVPFAISSITGASAYVPTKDGNYLVMGDALESTIEAGTPVMLVGATDAGSYTAYIKTDVAPVSSPEDNALTGTFTGTSIDCTKQTGTNYVLGFDRDNNNRIGFYHVNSSSYSLKANRAYLNLTGGDARGFTLMFDDVVTGIVAPIGETEEGTVIYNLSGQRLNKVQKGINIVNGKKVLF